MAESLLNRLLSATSARPRANASPFISGDYTLQQGTNVTLTQLGSVITIDASLAALGERTQGGLRQRLWMTPAPPRKHRIVHSRSTGALCR